MVRKASQAMMGALSTVPQNIQKGVASFFSTDQWRHHPESLTAWKDNLACVSSTSLVVKMKWAEGI